MDLSRILLAVIKQNRKASKNYFKKAIKKQRNIKHIIDFFVIQFNNDLQHDQVITSGPAEPMG